MNLLQIIPWLVLFLPLLAALVVTLFTQRDRTLSSGLSIAAVCISFTLAFLYFLITGGQPPRKEIAANWLSIGDLQVEFGLLLNPLSVLMMLIVTGVGGLIHIYSYGYMHDDPGRSRYFACL